MITTFELKNRACCRLIFRQPYYIKNLFMILLLAIVLLLNYLINFRKDKAIITSVTKLIAGLNSHTFNFLETHDQTLFITDKLKSISVTRVTSVVFYSSCVGVSRPCLLSGMAKEWPAFNKWQEKKAGLTYLQK